MREYSFPTFNLNTVSRLSAHGKLRPDNVWEVKASGAVYDGRELFRAMFNVGQVSASQACPARSPAST